MFYVNKMIMHHPQDALNALQNKAAPRTKIRSILTRF
jgi:hypothetical protein